MFISYPLKYIRYPPNYVESETLLVSQKLVALLKFKNSMWQRIKNSLWYQNKTNPKEQLQGNEFYQLERACEHHLPCTTSKPILTCYAAPALVTPKTQDLKMYCMVIYSFFYIYVCMNK